jgi:hypothetical protein
VATNNTLSNGKWYHFCATYLPDPVGGNGYGELFLDGQIEGTVSFGSDILYTGYGSQNLRFADSNHGAAQYYEGAIDDVRIYSKGLSVSEVQKLYAESVKKYLTLDH